MARTVTPTRAPKSDRIPPYSEEAERGVLGSILLDPHRVMDLCIERKIMPESFYVPAHRVLYEALISMSQKGGLIDNLTLVDNLKAAGQLEYVGGSLYLEQLQDSTPTSAHADYYIEIVWQKHLLRAIIDRSREAIEKCYDPELPAEEVLGQTEQSFSDIGGAAITSLTMWGDLIKEAVKEIELIHENKRGVTGISTGYKDLDEKLMGLQPSDMIILAARPSMGKTSLAMNIAEKVALGENKDKTPRPVAVFSLEMSREQLVRRMICCRARVSSHVLSKGILTKVNHGYLINAADALQKAKIYIDDTAGLSAPELRSRARRLHKRFGVQLIVIDYLQLLNYSQYAKEGRQRETAAISGALKAMAKELRVPVLVLSQLSRAPETRDKLAVPKLSDLRDSGSIEQDADVVALLRRPCKYPEDEFADDKTLSILNIAKHRNGPTGDIHLHFEEEYTRFEDRVRHGVDDPSGYVPIEEGPLE
jgi:replicative DNA helicase